MYYVDLITVHNMRNEETARGQLMTYTRLNTLNTYTLMYFFPYYRTLEFYYKHNMMSMEEV